MARTLTLAVVLIGLLTVGCGAPAEQPGAVADEAVEVEGPTGEASEHEVEAGALVDVPDVTAEDGADAVSELEALGLTVSFEKDDGRDPAGCTVADQDTAGEAEEGAEVTLTLDCRQIDWENQEGEEWETFNQSYIDGWDAGCDEAFNQSPDGSLYYDDEEFTALECQGNNPGDAGSADIPVDAPDDPASEGETLGASDGCNSAFEDLSPDGMTLYWGEDAYDASYCP